VLGTQSRLYHVVDVKKAREIRTQDDRAGWPYSMTSSALWMWRVGLVRGPSMTEGCARADTSVK